MTIASTRVTLLFNVLDGAEEASTGFSTFPVPGAGQAEMEAYALTAATLFVQEVWDTLKTIYPPETTFLGAQARTYNVDNDLIASGESLYVTPIAGTSSVDGLPVQTAIVVSLRTPAPGARGRGRMYLPAPDVGSITQLGRLASTRQQTVADLLRDFFDAWNAASTTEAAGVVSQVGSSVTALNQVRVGNVFDTQRRRRDQLPEVYVTNALA